MNDIRFFSNNDVLDKITMADALNLVEDAFQRWGGDDFVMPSKVYIDIPEHHGDFRAMPAYDRQHAIAGIKWVNSHAKNAEKKLPSVMAMMIVNDATTGEPKAVLEAGAITSLRTGAGGGVAAKYLARPESSVLLLVGAGEQAYYQALAINEYINLTKIIISDIDLARSSILKERLNMHIDCDIMSGPPEESAAMADIIVTTTPVRQPILFADWVKPGTHINAIGADAEGKQEIESKLLTNSVVVVDDMEQACHSGEVNVPLHKGIIQKTDIRGTLSDVINKKVNGRQHHDDITLFDSTGLAIQDLVLASFMIDNI